VSAPAKGKTALLSEHTRHEIDHWVAKFPKGKTALGRAVGAALRAGTEHGFLTPDLMDAVADYLELAPILVYEVASFYSMFETHPCGRHHVSVCTNISCFLNGGEEILSYCERKLGIKVGESTKDGAFSSRRKRSASRPASVRR